MNYRFYENIYTQNIKLNLLLNCHIEKCNIELST